LKLVLQPLDVPFQRAMIVSNLRLLRGMPVHKMPSDDYDAEGVFP
jgi:hypothetical protein